MFEKCRWVGVLSLGPSPPPLPTYAGTVFMFACFSMAGTHESYIPMHTHISHHVSCMNIFLFDLDSNHKPYFLNLNCAQIIRK